MADLSFQNIVPDPLLSAAELLSSWIAGNPVDVLVTNLNQPESMIRKFPRKDVLIAPSE
jgi:hypothetical protein